LDAISLFSGVVMTVSAKWVDETVQIPELMRQAPNVRPVLDRYGLRGCGGPNPWTDMDTAEESTRFVDAIYRPFFKAGIAVVLTLGAAWGALLLLRIALTGHFSAAGLHEVNAHGHAQIFGWVGLFVMGFAYQAFPRFKHASLAFPHLAWASLGLMVAGLIGRSVCEPLASSVPWVAPVAVASAWLEVAAIGLFAWVILGTWRGAGKALAFYDYYILAALGWFVVQAVAEAVYLAATLAAASREELLALVATWQGAIRDAQIHGFALLMILGVSQLFLHHIYGFPVPSRRLSLVALVCLNLAVAGEIAGLVLMRSAGPALAGLWYASAFLLTGVIVALVWNWRIFGPASEGDRSLKFLRAAYAWLLISLGMVVLLPAYQFLLLPGLAPSSQAAELGFSHAYYSAIRHAITVGFISLMIVGVAARVVPTLNGVDIHRLAPLWGSFLLLNVGCALRVVAQTLTDFTPHAFPVAGISGLLEVSGLALWGVHLWTAMAGQACRRLGREPGPVVEALNKPSAATPHQLPSLPIASVS
jgi:hypothetical protein